jgi:hypothetical protein
VADTEILIKFEGGDADRYHGVDMRLLGRSLAGFDRIISDGLILITENRVARHRERAPIVIIAKEPRKGSAEFYGDLAPAIGMFPFAWQLVQDGAGKIVWSWVSFVLEYFGGRKADAEKHLETIVRLREIEAQERQLSEERWHEQMGAFRDQTFQVLNKLVDASQQAVSPVGPSVTKVNFISGPSPGTEIDAAKADAIRAGGDFDVGDLQRMTLKTDGFVFHNRKLNVHHPDGSGRFISADVKDPIFDKEENVYARAAARKASIRVQAKPVYRGGKLERLYIMDFEGEIDEAA